ncbi:MAG TPA: prepilin-type N-terminal cleavage/methylation domain-containing protein [Thermodesulfobacteriota bacterium]|nr:prepilin-type N-terminal cleavage/methylation domain-containing protein [Thermodesulfobacteriota bacterium]
MTRKLSSNILPGDGKNPRSGGHVPRSRKGCCSGFTLVEIAIVVAIIGTLATIAIPSYWQYIEKVKISRAIVEIYGLEKEIIIYEPLPNSLAEIGQGGLLDPWGHPYEYLKVEGAKKGKLRKDRFMVPVNSDFDLYSMGKDGKTATPFTAKASRDDIVRASDGAYVGLASNY